MPPEIYKCLVVGPRNVGKSSLVRRYLRGDFEKSYTATVGVDMKVAQLDLPDGSVALTVVDLGGQQTFAALRNRYFQGAHHIILCYDKTDRSTFDEMTKWYEAISQGMLFKAHSSMFGTLVANKSDLEDQFEVTTEEGEDLAKLLAMDFFETSALTGDKVSELFIHAASASRESLQNMRTSLVSKAA